MSMDSCAYSNDRAFSGDRLSMIRIGMTDTSPEVTPPTIHTMKVCACQDNPVGDGETQALPCGTRGRYLVVLLEKAEGTLTLCEVEVFEGMTVVV